MNRCLWSKKEIGRKKFQTPDYKSVPHQKSRIIIRRYPLDRKKHGLIRRTALNRHRFRRTRLFQSSNEFHCRIQNGFYICVESIERTGPYRMKLGAPRSLNCRQPRCRKCRKKFHPFVHCSFDIDNWNVYYRNGHLCRSNVFIRQTLSKSIIIKIVQDNCCHMKLYDIQITKI